MSDKAKTEQIITVEIDRETLRRIAELLPAVAQWARECHGQPATSPADIVSLAVAVLHAQVSSKIEAMLEDIEDAEAEGPRPVTEGLPRGMH